MIALVNKPNLIARRAVGSILGSEIAVVSIHAPSPDRA